MKLWQKVTLGLILGIIFGIYLPEYVSYIKPIGDIFLRMIKMIIAPLIFFSLVTGIVSMSDPSSLGRVGMKAIMAFFSTTFFAVIFGIIVALLLKPGQGINIDFGLAQNIDKAPSFDMVNFFINVIPDNAVGTFVNNNILQVVFFAIFTGVILNKMGTSASSIKDLFHVISKMILQMISVIVQFSPYATFALTAWIVGIQGMAIMISLCKLVCAITIAMILQYAIFGLFILVFCRMSPVPFYKKSLEYQLIAFSTGSSKASLATTMKVCREKLGISESSTSFVLPLGASINMDGLSIKLGLAVIFFAQILHIDLSIMDYMLVILTSTLGSIGGAGIPGSFIIMLPVVLSSINLPIEGVALLVGIDRVLDLLSTTINITGDATITLIVDHSEGTLDKEKYLS